MACTPASGKFLATAVKGFSSRRLSVSEKVCDLLGFSSDRIGGMGDANPTSRRFCMLRRSSMPNEVNQYAGVDRSNVGTSDYGQVVAFLKWEAHPGSCAIEKSSGRHY